MSELAIPSVEMLWLSLFTFLLSLVFAGQQVVSWFVRGNGAWRLQWVTVVTATLVFSLLAVGTMQSIEQPSRPELTALIQVAIILSTCLLSWMYGWHTLRTAGKLGRYWTRVRMSLLLTSLAGVAWSAWLYYSVAMPEFYVERPMIRPAKHANASRRFIGVTDRGRDVALLRWNPESQSHATTIWSSIAEQIRMAPTSIQRAGPDTRSNCHGWVFTGGRFLLDGAGVARILEDNGYLAVTSPQASDVVIYRDANGVINHTGLVKAVLADGTVLVESKWSVGARFLHLPEDQPYSSKFMYYRTSRPSHVVAIRVRSEVPFSNSTQRGPTKQVDAGSRQQSNPKTRNGDRVAVRFFKLGLYPAACSLRLL